MTIEEKARAYDEALKRAKAAIDVAADKDLVKGVATTIFPQLRESESEDERIRKWLADYFSSIKKTVWIHRDITCEQILEWLEKQKENPKNAISIPADCASNAKCPYKIHGDEDFIGDIKDTPAYHFGFDEGVRSEREMQKEQKPAWSEEDKKMIEYLIGSLVSLKGYVQDNISFSESIKDGILKRIELEQAWLKSLRPSWKPSEEQMEALEECGECKRCIKELREQLKKL